MLGAACGTFDSVARISGSCCKLLESLTDIDFVPVDAHMRKVALLPY